MGQIGEISKTIVMGGFHFSLVGKEFVDEIHQGVSSNKICVTPGAFTFCSFCGFFLAFSYSTVKRIKMVGQSLNFILGCIIPSILFLKMFRFINLI
jgi:hypothetical protein